MRYKEYNVNRVLEKCIQLFWKNGFRGSSVKEIVDYTGVNRFSLYHEFQNKEGVLYNTLRLYRARQCQDKLDILTRSGDLAKILQQFYLSFLDVNAEHRGCYFIHIGTELSDSDSTIREDVKNYLKELEILFIDLLIRHDYPIKSSGFYARHLVNLYCTSMSFCLIHTEIQRFNHIENGINIILNKKFEYAQST